MLAERTEYLSSGVHIGMKSCTKYLKQFVYKIRDDGLAVFNLRKVDSRIAIAANFISQFDNVLIVSRKGNAADAILKFAEITGAKAIAGRFSPGTLTNPSYRDFFEPDVVISIDPLVDENAIKEAKKKRIPMIAFCDTFNEATDIDLVIPINNNGKKALALVLMLLSKEILRKRGKLKKDSDFKYTVEDFGGELPQERPRTEPAGKPRYDKGEAKAVKTEKKAEEKPKVVKKEVKPAKKSGEKPKAVKKTARKAAKKSE
ncbi:MAG: 30S ribosomal protein S2 [Candidatus Aenigmarchaeota archaeon]|nr:30S ribosomal protein S2 [Candidatus Aenigmarchaeota archaeon]